MKHPTMEVVVTDSILPGRSGASAALTRPSAGSLLMAANIVAAAVVFWYGFEALVVAWQTPEYSHGPIIPMLSAYMFMREMKSVPPTSKPITDRWPGVLVVIGALAIGVLGLMVRIPDIVTYAMILWIGGTILTVFGLKRGWYFWPSVLHLIFMLPLPNFIYWPLSVFLQTVSSEIGVGFISFVGIPVFLDGNVIDLGVYKLQVAEACSGLRYLFPVMSFSYVFGVLYTGPKWHKIVLLLSAAPITVLMNSFRIGVIGVMVDNFGIEHAEGFLHAFEGWVIFVACVGILFGLAAAMQRLQPEPKPLSESIDLDFDGLAPQFARGLAIPVTRALVAITALSTVVAVAWSVAPSRSIEVPDRQPLVLFPKQLGEWRGSVDQLDPIIEAVLGADDYLQATFTHPDMVAPVDLFVAYYHKQTEGSGIHSPEVCLPTGGWEVSAWQERQIALGDAAGTTFPVNSAIIQKGLNRQLVYYWFEQRGRRVTSDYYAKAVTVLDSLTRGRTDGALARVITPIGAGESVEDAEARLLSMLQHAVPRLGAHVPE
ncbi:MAG: VPLPA-CTERM-specific exosortase XrtD [Pseudomonadota bacterium]